MEASSAAQRGPPSQINPFSEVPLNDLTGKVQKSDEDAIGGGVYSDVYKGTWMDGSSTTKVAIKVIRPHVHRKEEIAKLDRRLRRETRIWGKLNHSNIVLLHGITSDFGKYPAMVCQWMDQSHLDEYLQQRPDLDLRGRLDICLAVAQGLSYLHSNKVIHGDLHPGNILMDGDVAHLSDFGLSNVIAELQGPSFLTSKVGGAVRWIAPELLQATDNNGDEITPELTMQCDVYSFASVAFFIIARLLPYAHMKNNNAVIADIVRKIESESDTFPPRPSHPLLTDACWEILTRCWARIPHERPEIREVNLLLQALQV